MKQRALENHAPICGVPKCPYKTEARLTDGERRRDLCRRHAIVSVKFIPDIHVIATWGGLTMEDFDD